MSEQRPVIGVVAAVEQAKYGPWDRRCALLQVSYLDAIQAAGGMVVLIAPDPALIDNPDEILSRIDALILAGGSDVDPASYGAQADPATEGTTPERDVLELALLTRAIELDLPVLGICRGLQILNIACGGTLIQHLPDVVHSDEHRRHSGTFVGNEHSVQLVPGSLAARAAGQEHAQILSHHHQAIGELGEGLTVTGHCPDDGIIEAVELTDHGYVLGVQWHPEAEATSRVIGSLVSAARQSSVRS